MNLMRVRLLTVLAVPLLAACGAEPSGPTEAARTTYTCCAARDVDAPYRPGQTLTVHWTVESPDGPGGHPPQVELAAHLTGPFATVADLKAAAEGTPSAPGLVTFSAAPVRPTGEPDEQPVSTIVIGPDAEPGFYNLATWVVGDDTTTSRGSSVVQVVPKV